LLLQLGADVNEVMIDDKNILTGGAVDALVTSSRTPETRATYDSLKSLITSSFALADQSIDQGPEGYMDDAARKMSNGEGCNMRLKVMEVLNEQVSIRTEALEKSIEEAKTLASQTSWTLITSPTRPSLSS
jgi:CHASE3 domain sensor protein